MANEAVNGGMTTPVRAKFAGGLLGWISVLEEARKASRTSLRARRSTND